MNTAVQTQRGAVAAPAPGRIPWGFAEIFAISQTALPAVLIVPGTQAFRLPIRAAAFIISLGALVWYFASPHAKVRAPRVQSWVAAVIALLAVMIFHPSTPSVVAGLAHAAVYIAVIAPVFWAPSLVDSPERLARIMWILLVCAGLNSVVGVLQVYDPDRWLPAEFSRVMMQQELGLGPVSFIGPDGREMVRPPGLFDTPGSVAGPAAYAALLGLVFAVSRIAAWRRLLSLTFAGAGLAAIYLSQVRISWAVTVGMMLAYTLTLARQGRVGRATQFAILAGGIFIGGFVLAVTLGGQAITDRFSTLFATDPLSVYRTARGQHLNVTFDEMLVQHPFGAGLARWGMAASYFSHFSELNPPLWAEIQLAGWMLDGGIVLVMLYVGALLLTAVRQWIVAMTSSDPRLATCGAVVLAANLGTAAMIFSFTPFVAQIGIQYWFLAGALHGVAARRGIDGA